MAEKARRCAWPRCRQRDDGDGIVVLGTFLCNRHWSRYAELPIGEGRKKIGLAPPARQDRREV